MFSSMKKIIAILLCVAMTLTNAGVSTFATSIERVATTAKQVDSNRKTIDYRFYEAFKYEKRISYLMKDDESDSLKESMQQGEPSSGIEESTKTSNNVSPSFDVENDDANDDKSRSTLSDADDDSENDDENTTGNNIEEPEDDGTIKKVSDDDTDTAMVSDADDSSGSAVIDEPEDDDTDTATVSDADTTADSNENDETESDDTTATTSYADATESLNLNYENNEIKNDDTTATTSNADVLNDDNKASDSDAKKLPLNLQPMIASDSESTLFGATAYTLPNTWYNPTSAGTSKYYVQSITISKYPTPAPTTYTHHYTITGSDGLEVYANVTGSGTSQRSDVTIYAPENKTIYAAGDSTRLFDEFRIITNLDLSLINTSNVTNMEYMFWNCLALTSLDLSSFNTASVSDMSSMFGGCTALTSLDVSSFNTSNVTDMQYMFNACRTLTSLDLSSFNTSNVTDMKYMFFNCSALTSLDLSSFNTASVSDISRMFYSCPALTSLDVSSFNTSNVTDMCMMFWSCQALTSLDLSNFNTSKVTDMNRMFSDCQTLTNLNVSSFNTSNVTNMSEMFDGCYALTSLNVSNFDTSNVTNMSYMFRNCQALTSLNVSNFDTSNVTDMCMMFWNCQALTSLNVSNFDTSNVTNMVEMFCNCRYLTTIIASTSFVTTAVTAGNDAGMFSSCNVLEGGNGTKYSDRYAADPTTAINKTYAKIDRVGDPGYFTFTGPYYTLPNTWYNETSAGTAKQYVQSITTSKYPTPAPTTYTHNYTIPGSDGLRVYSNVTGTGTSQRSDVTIYAPADKTIYAAEDSSRLFYEFRIITSLDLSNLDTSNVTNMVEMFCNCRYLTTIIASTSFVTTAVTAGNDADMFSGCNVLEGGNGTKYADRYAADPTTANNKTYAWIDGRHAQGGYFRGTGDGSGSGTDGDGTKAHIIRVKASPSKIDYEVTDYFNPAGLVLEVQWTDGYKSDVTFNSTTERDFTFNPATTSELQLTDTNVIITYRGKNTDLPINMSPSRSIDSIKVKKKPKHKYIIGQKFDPSGLEISAKYNDGTITPNIKYNENKVDFTFDISLENPLNRLDNIVVTITYKGVHTTFDITVSKNSNAYGTSNGGGGGGGGARIAAGLPVTEMNTVIESITLSSDYDWIYDEEGQREGVKLKKESSLAKSLMSSNDYKENYKDAGEEGYIQIQNGFYNLQYAGASFYFGFSPVGKMLTGFVKTKDDTEHYWVDDTKFTLTDIGKQDSAKYYLYNDNSDYKGIVWNLPITIGNTLYTFDVSGRVLTETYVPNNDVVALSTTGWDYNPIDDSWKYYNTDSMGNRYYIKDEVKEITDRGVSHYYIFGEDEKMKTGLTEYKGKTYYLVENGEYKGAVYTGMLPLGGKVLTFDEQGVLVSDKKEVKALNTTQ